MSDNRDEQINVLSTEIFDEVRKSKFWVIENSDIVDEQELEYLMSLMFNCPEGDFMLFVPENESICPVLRKAMDSNLIISGGWKRNYYPHPNSRRDYVHIIRGKTRWSWQEELLDNAQEHLCFDLTLSEAARRKMQIDQHISAQLAAESNPIELKPNFMGLGIDVYKAWGWVRKTLRF